MNQREALKKIINNNPAHSWQPTSETAETDEALLESGDQKCCRQQSWKNDRGNMVRPGSAPNADRYVFDTKHCASKNGWVQYDTDQDAWYFGIWVHAEERLTFTYAEGDLSLVVCETEESFQAELANMAEFYGAPPPAFRVIGDNFKAEVYAKENAFGREIPKDGVAVDTVAEAAKLVLT